MAINFRELRQRVGVGTIYVVITAICTLVSWHTTVIVIAATSALCCYEFLRMAQNAGHHPYIWIGTAAAGLMPLSMSVAAIVADNHLVAPAFTVSFFASIIMLLRYFANIEDTIIDVALTLFAVLYTGLTLSSFILVRMQLPGIEGGVLGFIVLASVWINDGFAYLGGSMFGRHKFAPHISPKKTWEGVWIGLVGSVLTFLIIPLVLPDCGFGFVWAAVAGLFVGAAGIIGDLTESHIKRGFSQKDSGDIMPGHGGLLDRTDSLLFSSVMAYGFIAAAPYILNFTGVWL